MSQAKAYVSALLERETAYASEAAALKTELERHDDAASRLDGQIERNRREMGGYLVPDIDDETLRGLERRFHYPALMAQKATYVAAITAAETEREALEADETFINREISRIEAQTTMADVGPSYDEVCTLKEPWDAEPRHATLIKGGFYDASPPTGLMRGLSYWRQGSLLMAALEKRQLPRFKDLNDLRGRWTAIMDDYTPLHGAVTSATATLQHMDMLEARHQLLLAEPANQFKACFEAVGRSLVEHLLAIAEDSLVQYARTDPNLASFLKKDAGLRKQVAYLRELAQVRLAPAINALEAESIKAGSKARRVKGKIARGRSVRVSQQDVARTRTFPHEKWQKRRDSYEKTRDRIVTYHDYDRGSFVTEYLWWDVMTRGSRGDDLYEVRTFHERHPDWSAAAFVDPAAVGLSASETYPDDAAAAFADQLMSEDPADGLFDAS